MTDQDPIKVTNLDRYGNPPLEWSRARTLLETLEERDTTFFLGTIRPDGRPHSAAVGAVWIDGEVYFTSSPKARKARNLAANPACTVSVKLTGLDLVFEGEVIRVTDPPTLERIAKLYREGGWPAEVQGDAFTAPFYAPSGGPPPWYLYQFKFHTAFGVATAEPNGATRWRFKR
jgi:hypothetical protein